MNSSSSNDNNGEPISAAALPGQAVDIERDVSRPVSRNEDSSINGTDPSSAIDLEKTAGETAQLSSSKEVQYSVFPRNQKYFIVFMASLGSFFSPLSANIYFPALNTLASHYNVTPSMINLTITTYQICQGLAPSVYGDFSDQAGRRPAFIVAFVIYVAANIGLAVQNSYAALMVLRCLQSSGSSGTIALSLGIIADVTTTAERGTYMGLALSGAMLASAIGPIIGGLLTQFLGWRAIFWFLTIFSGSYTFIYIILMPETNRTIVGNGSVAPREWWNMSGIDMLRLRKLRRNETKEARELRESLPKNKVRWPRPWTSLQVMKEKDVAAVLFFNSIVNCAFYDVIATTPLQFERLYGYNSVQIGLCYLPLGVGSFIAAIVNGKIIDWNLRRIARANNFPIDKKRAQDLRNFPIEKARMQTLLPIFLPGVATVLCYGWVLQQSSPLVAPLILQFIIGLSFTSAANTGSTLLVDLYSAKPATITAANNLARCLMGAGATALINPMIDGMGIGWCYTFIGLVCFITTPMLLLLIKKGPAWREARRLKHEQPK